MEEVLASCCFMNAAVFATISSSDGLSAPPALRQLWPAFWTMRISTGACEEPRVRRRSRAQIAS